MARLKDNLPKLFQAAERRFRCRPPDLGFRDGTNRLEICGLEHIRHHHERRLLIVWLLSCLALTLERLYRLRYLHRGLHSVRSAINLLRLLVLGLSLPVLTDSS